MNRNALRRISFATLLALGAAVGACAGRPARIHPDFRSRAPEAIQVEVRNETLHSDLDRYRVSRFLQTSIFGPSEVNVLAELSQAARELLVELGYSVEHARTGEAGAVLRVRVLSWGLAPISLGGGLRAQLDFELIDYPANEVLYQRLEVMDSSRDDTRPSGLSGLEVQSALRRTVRRGLASLPPRSGGPP